MTERSAESSRPSLTTEWTLRSPARRPRAQNSAPKKASTSRIRDLCLASLTADDLKALEFIVQYADIVGYSFVRSEADVRDLQAQLEKLGAGEMGIILKIETRAGIRESSADSARRDEESPRSA